MSSWRFGHFLNQARRINITDVRALSWQLPRQRLRAIIGQCEIQRERKERKKGRIPLLNVQAAILKNLKRPSTTARAFDEGSLPREPVVHFSSSFCETRLRPSRYTSVSVCRLPDGVVSPKTHAQDYTLRDEIPGSKRRKRGRIHGTGGRGGGDRIARRGRY